MSDSSFWLQSPQDSLVVGSTGKGKSLLLQQYADQEGISYEEAERRCQPTEEMLAQQRKLEEEQQLKDTKRLQAVRDAYWTLSDEDEFYCIHDACSEFLDMELSKEQSKCIFDCLPADIIGSGIQWGFDDTEVRDTIYCYIRDNAVNIKEHLNWN